MAEELDDPGLELGDGENLENDGFLDDAELNTERTQYANDGYDPRAQRRRDAQKRIDRLVYERNVERDTNKRIQAELAETRRLVEELRQKDQAQAQTDAQSQRAALLAKKRDALDLGNSEEVIRLDEELFELSVKQYRTPETRQPPRQEQRPPANEPPSVSPAAMAWLERNPWANDPRHKKRYDAANQVYQDMITKERFDPNDDFTFQELDYRIRQAAPPTVGGGVDRGNLSGRTNNGLAITAEDKAKMRGWGLDPDSAEERKAWLRSKQQARGGDRGGY